MEKTAPFDHGMEDRIKEIEAILNKYLPEAAGYQKTVLEAMNYSVRSGGKRLRPMLMLETYKLFGGSSQVVEPFMAALEMIHTYSLVHDDLPCMDNDEYRRGRKTTHAVYGEGMAVLAGDALLNYAFETACKAFECEEDLTRSAKAVRLLADKAGIYGMIGGQTADIEAEDMPAHLIDQSRLLYIHENKTAALIQSAMMIGGILAGAGEEDCVKLNRIACNIGVAFQIQDDILDVTSSLEVLGKQTGSDEKNHKVTYVTLNGMEESVKEVNRLSREALTELGSFERHNLFLEELVENLITRIK